ncbi:indolepyruvate ferredoxin oxidoreductase family protein [Azospirillum picis]|uniref:Indolepyruvate ferredoxin oxidoreductase n=1 Tax=Azospirillum picis TaxID=488438 RepID=A0ABU0MHM7_9PROT|nr:indolepyruvate ferredoxin oxidoreductase family protein [Azospirillum picis]MBP2298806.1 indolepyruvate ferredoxin oxidoreductase [Azospirillum picis]MDQ0532952.1 indolepyruvate ferredoxin oxidoreductase [Azospirillum picis]
MHGNAQERPTQTDAIIDETYELAHRYTRDTGRVFLTGTQALLRIMIDQSRSDRESGRKTAGFVSGYRGSPLGGVDQELWRQKALLDRHDIRFEPGLNEDLAASMVWGTQQIDAYPGKRVDGVFSLWYGKGPGVDRTGDVFRNANILGTSAQGGVLAVAGDDHAAQSSTFPHQTDHVFEAAMMPIVHPADLGEYLTFGLAGFALSRFTGLWVGFKAITETVESGQTLVLPPLPRFSTPADFVVPPHGLNHDPALRLPAQRTELERRLVEERLPAVGAFTRANPFDRMLFGTPDARIGIVTVGKAHHDLLRALRLLVWSEERAVAAGIALYKVGLSWPVEPEGIRRFARGKRTLIVLEEKRSFVEAQIRQILYDMAADVRPEIAGKTWRNGTPLLPAVMEFSPELVAGALGRVLRDHGIDVAAPPLSADDGRPAAGPPLLVRKPYFCSGCPHNTSTRVPTGSVAAGGIGCHIMAVGDERQTRTASHMGGEGAPWVGLSSFTTLPHLFANLGDGTYQHSGILAIRQAVAAKARITYKILYNNAVAMTGGQPTEGAPTVDGIARQVAAEGVARIAFVGETGEPPVPTARFPTGTTFHHRDELDAVQQELRDYDGVSVLLYDQTCAAEKRRRRKKGEAPDPDLRVFINDRVCEGCGDCSVQSTCIAVEPKETAFGRKRQINQSACNKDTSCLKGFCPSLLSVRGAAPRRPARAAFDLFEERYATIPDPQHVKEHEADRPFSLLVAGMGGTGVVTVGAILAMAAHLEGLSARTLDFTGVAQKNGAVVSHVQIATADHVLDVPRVPAGALDLLIACDLVAATTPETRSRCTPDRTAVIGNLNVTPTADFVSTPNLVIDPARHRRVVESVTHPGQGSFLNAGDLAVRLFGDTIAANLLLVGVAYQQGFLPLAEQAILRAIELNGTAVAMSKAAFRCGRIVAARPEAAEAILNGGPDDRSARAAATPPSLPDERIAFYAKELEAYQDRAYAARYTRLLQRVSDHEVRLAGVAGALTATVADAYYRLLAYKDEYEVARLYSDPAFRERLAAAFDGEPKIQIHMAPPLIAPVDPATGRRRKRAFEGRWILPLLRLLRHGRRLRGTRFDPFGYQEDRVQERRLIALFEADVSAVLSTPTATLPAACALLAWPLEVRGFGPVKAEHWRRVEPRRQELLDALGGDGQRHAAE